MNGQTATGNPLYDTISWFGSRLTKNITTDTLFYLKKIDSLIESAKKESNCEAIAHGYHVKGYILRNSHEESLYCYLMTAYLGQRCNASPVHANKMASVFRHLGYLSSKFNEYDLAIQFAENGLNYAYALSDTSQILGLLNNMGHAYYKNASYYDVLFVAYLEKSYQKTSSWERTRSEIRIGNSLFSLGKLDEALEIEKALILKVKRATHKRRSAYIGYLHNNIGNVFKEKLESDSAIFYYEKAIAFKERLIGTNLNRGLLMGSISSLAELYMEKEAYENARRVLLKGVKYIEGEDDQNLAINKFNLEVYQQLVQLYKVLEKKDSVEIFKEKYQNQLNHYTDLSKKMNVQSLVDKFYADREKEELDARNEVYLFWFLITVFSISFLSTCIFLYQKRKAKRMIKTTKHDKRLAELKALKAQVNPHFLFNSLNSIYSFILEEDSERAEEYLLKYGKLMRKILDHSNLLTVPLNDELETLRLYVDLERLRLGYDFHYEVQINLPLSEENISFPSMIIQPFIENAIWHGIADLAKEGKIKLSIEQKEDVIHVEILDNGNGVHFTTKAKNREVRGIDIIRERLQLLTPSSVPYQVLELSSNAKGTKVSLRFPANVLDIKSPLSDLNWG
ncbi:MAG: histidine kinase [Ekhidna sp.]